MGFVRRIEDFQCARCGAPVSGDGFTNHCPRCLWSRHVDVDPGDRAHPCQGMMEPIEAFYKRDELVIVHRCVACDLVRNNRTAPDDDDDALRALFGGAARADAAGERRPRTS